MSGPNPPGSDEPAQEKTSTGETEIYSRAYSAPESEQFTSGPYVPPDPALYDYDTVRAAGGGILGSQTVVPKQEADGDIVGAAAWVEAWQAFKVG